MQSCGFLAQCIRVRNIKKKKIEKREEKKTKRKWREKEEMEKNESGKKIKDNGALTRRVINNQINEIYFSVKCESGKGRLMFVGGFSRCAGVSVRLA